MGNQTTLNHSKSLSAAGIDGKTTGNTSGGSGHPGRPLGNHDEKRAELIRAAIAVTVEEGYARASMRRIAQRAGYTTGAVTYYFSNKEELGVAIAHNLFDRFEELLSASENQDNLRVLVEKWFDWAKSDKADLWLALFQLLAHAKQEPAFAEIVERRYLRFRQVLTSKLANGQSQGTVRRDIPAAELADQISAMTDGWMVFMPIDLDRFTEDGAKALKDSLIVLLSPRRSGSRPLRNQ
jgi:AcrR family transcriptional regulator